MAGRDATWIPVQAQPIMTMILLGAVSVMVLAFTTGSQIFTFQLSPSLHPNAVTKLPMSMKIKYGIMVGSLISGSRIPLFLLVSFILIQSLRGPAVTKPIMAPIRMAKLKKPIVNGVKLYGGTAKAWVCVRFIAKKHDALQDTTNEANSMIGNATSFHGIQRSKTMLLNGCGLLWNSLNCCLLGLPLPRYGSR